MAQFPVVDLFAGPGGLGEGFSTFESPESPAGYRPFRVIASVEKDSAACRTLRLRNFYRHLLWAGHAAALDHYYAYVRGERDSPLDPAQPDVAAIWQMVFHDVLEQPLGEPETSIRLRSRIEQAGITPHTPLLLIGGPPCQAYSSAGRSRNAGNSQYRPELDGRHFLYRIYLELLREYQPVAFILENVKGMLSSHIGGRRLFPRILQDLTSPALTDGQDGRRIRPRYRIYSIVDGFCYSYDQPADAVQHSRFIVQAEHYGIPQARHRVILIGLREDLARIFDQRGGVFPRLSPLTDASGQLRHISTREALADLPPLHSRLSWLRSELPIGDWASTLATLVERFAPLIEDENLRVAFIQAANQAAVDTQHLSVAAPLQTGRPAELSDWYRGSDPPLVLNHEVRSHMPEDLARYLFCAVHARQYGVSPKAAHFPAALAPRHRNWESGKFNDRFRVQVAEQPSTTIVSHFAKDGHYAIHRILRERPRRLRRGGRAGRTKFGFFLECAELRIAITIRTLNNFAVSIANALNHPLRDLRVETSRGTNGNTPKIGTGFLAFGDFGFHHVPGLESLNAFLSSQIAARESIGIESSSLITAASRRFNR
ncbi:MAG: DNA cytosine methyltransferase [Candidatus Contendobacter sp.]|nr:DNA cytosine methyltransferase [Candidatus Contendobacter sp.]